MSTGRTRSRLLRVLAILALIALGVYAYWDNTPTRKVGRLLAELADRPGGHIDFFYTGRASEAIQADIDAFGRRAVPALIDGLSHRDPGVRYIAAQQLGRLGDARAVDALIVCTGEDDPIIRSRSVRALGKIGSPRATETLLPLLDHEDVEFRLTVIEALGRIGDRRAYSPLLPHVEDKSIRIRAAAASAIGRTGDERALPILQSLLTTDPYSDVRTQAAAGLGHLGLPGATETLKAALEDKSPYVRQAAQESLKRME